MSRFIGNGSYPSCNACGCSNINVLSLDHVNNDGSKDRKEKTQRTIYKHAHSVKDKSLYQTLCYNCNWKKHLENLKNKENKGARYEYQHQYNSSLKIQCISYYSNSTCKCSRCGINDMEILCLDHINNDDNKHRKIVGMGGKTMYIWVIKNDFPPIFQVLCLNCNIEKQRLL